MSFLVRKLFNMREGLGKVFAGKTSYLFATSEAGGTLTYLFCSGNNFIERLYNLQTGYCGR